MLQATTVSVSVGRTWQDLYEAVWRPECFPYWASGLSGTFLERDGEAWTAQGPAGPVRIRFTDHNPYGVMDHVVELEGGQEVQVPMRIVGNGAGAEVLLTVFRQPGMSDAKYRADVAWVQRDLLALRDMATG